MRTLTVGLAVFAAAAFAQDSGTLQLPVGTQKVLTVPGIQRVAIGDSSIADVKTIGSNQLLIIGIGPGKTELLIWKQSGQKVSYQVVVKGNVDDLAAAGSEITLGQGEIANYRVGGATKVEVGDPSVAEATLEGGRLKLRAKGSGHSDLVVYKGTTELAHVAVTVPATATATDERRENATLGLSAIQLKVGTSVKLTIDGVEKTSSHDIKLVEAAITQPGSLAVTAKAAGDVTVDLTVRGVPAKLLVKAVP